MRTSILLVDRIERLVGVVHQREGGTSDVVGGKSESERFGLLDGTSRHAAGDGHEGVVVEGQARLVLHELTGAEHGIAAFEEGIGIVCLIVVRIATGVDECVSVLAGADVVASDGDTDGKLTVLVGGDVRAVLGARRAVDAELHTLDGNARTIVIYGTAHLEGADVLEVHTIVDERLCADEAVGLRGRELMDALRGTDGIGRSVAGERNTADGVVAVHVGDAADGELVLVRDKTGDIHLLDGTMVAVQHASRLRIVVGNDLFIDAFIELVIEVQPVLSTGEHTVVVAHHLLVAKSSGPHTAFVDVAEVRITAPIVSEFE